MNKQTPFREALAKAYQLGCTRRRHGFLVIDNLAAKYPAEDNARELLEVARDCRQTMKGIVEMGGVDRHILESLLNKAKAVLAKIDGANP